MANEQQLPDPEQITYEQARDELVAIVKKLETGSAPLEETLSMWERGEALAGRCHAILSKAEARMTRTTSKTASSTIDDDEEAPFEMEEN